MKILIIKKFTSGSFKGMSFNDQIKIKTVNDLGWCDLLGKEIDAIGPNYKVMGVSIYDEETDNYLTKKQAELKLKGF